MGLKDHVQLVEILAQWGFLLALVSTALAFVVVTSIAMFAGWVR